MTDCAQCTENRELGKKLGTALAIPVIKPAVFLVDGVPSCASHLAPLTTAAMRQHPRPILVSELVPAGAPS